MELMEVEATLPPRVKGQQVGTISFQLVDVSTFQNRTKDVGEANENGFLQHVIDLNEIEPTDIYCQFQFWGDETIVNLSRCSQSRPPVKTFAILGSIASLKHYFKDMGTLQLLVKHKTKEETIVTSDEQNAESSVTLLGCSSISLPETLKTLIEKLREQNHNNSYQMSDGSAQSQHQIKSKIYQTFPCGEGVIDDEINDDGEENEFSERNCERSTIGEIVINITLDIDLSDRQEKVDKSVDGSIVLGSGENEETIAPLTKIQLIGTSEHLNECRVSDKPQCTELIRVGEVKGVKEILTLWLENENALHLQSRDMHSDLTFAGILVTFEIISRGTTKSDDCMKQYNSTKIIRLEQSKQNYDFDFSNSIDIESLENMIENDFSDSIDFSLWYVPVFTEKILRQYPSTNRSKRIVPNGSKQVCYAKCPLKAVVSNANVTHICCPWQVPLTRNSENVEMIGQMNISFHVKTKPRTKETSFVNFCDFDERSLCDQHHLMHYDETFGFAEDLLALNPTQKEVVDEGRNKSPLKRNDRFDTNNEDSTVNDQLESSQIRDSFHLDNVKLPLTKNAPIEFSMLDSDVYENLSCSNLSAVLASLEVATTKVREAYRDNNVVDTHFNSISLASKGNQKNQSEESKYSSQPCLEAENNSETKEFESISVVSERKTSNEWKPQALSSLVSDVEDVSKDLSKVVSITNTEVIDSGYKSRYEEKNDIDYISEERNDFLSVLDVNEVLQMQEFKQLNATISDQFLSSTTNSSLLEEAHSIGDTSDSHCSLYDEQTIESQHERERDLKDSSLSSVDILDYDSQSDKKAAEISLIWSDEDSSSVSFSAVEFS